MTTLRAHAQALTRVTSSLPPAYAAVPDPDLLAEAIHLAERVDSAVREKMRRLREKAQAQREGTALPDVGVGSSAMPTPEGGKEQVSSPQPG